jgi:serine phosphatase RsbU (regulator of sigma subunit)
VNFVFLLLITGLAAAWVAREIRAHAEAALGEAETRRHMARIEHDLAIARSIQQALIPRAGPSIPGFDIAGWNRPADQTGGDYYDWQRMPDGAWIITLADVSGHGIGPAMVTAACRAYVRASASSHGDLPSLTSRINALLAADLPDGRFITMVSVLIDPGRVPVALLSAGHSPVVLYASSTGSVREIMPHDMPLAINPDQSFGPADSITLAPGDVLALVTDGFVEWARHDGHGKREEFGLQRLRESLRRHADLAASDMIAAITADVSAFAGAHSQQDDLTMVVIRRTHHPQS